jgi:protein O-mannosyl-transferase
VTGKAWVLPVTRRAWVLPLLVALLALGASVTSLGHDFTFDDRYVILENAHVHVLKDIWRLFGQSYWPKELGGDGYRPLVMSLFTLQWAIGGGAPWIFHLVNILLAVAAALAVQWCAAAMLSREAAWAAAALFAVHPVHVEVTGNVVGQSELLVAICLSLAVGIYLRARREGPLGRRAIVAILGLYVLGLLSKEHAIILPLLLAAAEWTVVRVSASPSEAHVPRLFGLLLVAVTAAYLFVLGRIHQDIAGFIPYPAFYYLHMSALDRAATMLLLLPRIAGLLLFPAQLRGDYSPTDVPLAQGLDFTQLPGVLICVGVVLLALALRRRSPVASFGLLWLIIAFLPVSNLLVPTGFLMAERTLFSPSIGLVLVAGAVLAELRMRAPRRQRWAAGVLAVLLVLGLTRSIDRQRVWKNNDVFFDTLVREAPNNYRAHFLRGRLMRAENRLPEMAAEYHRAIRLFAYDPKMMLGIAADYHNAGGCAQANAYLEWTYTIEPRASEGRYAYVECLAYVHRWDDSRSEALKAMSLMPGRWIRPLRAAVARADSALGRGHRVRQAATSGAVAFR